MGGGLRYALPNSTSGIAYDLHELNGDIYVGGQFNFAGGVHAENVARWNGHQWCGMGGHYVTQTPGGQVFSLASWRDSLYVGGNFVTIDGDTLHNVAKWLGEVENCSPSVGIEFHRGFKPLRAGLGVQDVARIAYLEQALEKPVQHFSSGMKQRLKLALAILSDTPLLLLDEPAITTGLIPYKTPLTLGSAPKCT